MIPGELNQTISQPKDLCIVNIFHTDGVKELSYIESCISDYEDIKNHIEKIIAKHSIGEVDIELVQYIANNSLNYNSFDNENLITDPKQFMNIFIRSLAQSTFKKIIT